MVTIRKGGEHDIDFVIQCQINMARETENIDLAMDIIGPGVRALFKDPTKGQYFIAELNDEPLGCCMTTYEWSDWRNGYVLWIQSVYVQKKHRGQGIFRALYMYIENIIRDNPDQYKGIRLYVDKTNKSAQKVYEALNMNGDHYKLYESFK